MINIHNIIILNQRNSIKFCRKRYRKRLHFFIGYIPFIFIQKIAKLHFEISIHLLY
jgi:hypothetical protein